MKACGLVAALALALASGCRALPAGPAALGRPIEPAIFGKIVVPTNRGPLFNDRICGVPTHVAFDAGHHLGLFASAAWLPLGAPIGAIAGKRREVILLPSALTGYAMAYAVGVPVLLFSVPGRIVRAARLHPGCCDHLEIGDRLVPHEPRVGLDQALYEALGRPETAAGAEAALRGRATAVPLLRKSGVTAPARAAAARRILGE